MFHAKLLQSVGRKKERRRIYQKLGKFIYSMFKNVLFFPPCFLQRFGLYSHTGYILHGNIIFSGFVVVNVLCTHTHISLHNVLLYEIAFAAGLVQAHPPQSRPL